MALSTTQIPDVEARSRNLAVFFLRAGLGVLLLNTGFIRHMGVRAGGLPGGYEILLPDLQIGLGLALILGIFTIPAAVGAGFLILVQPLVQTFILLGNNVNPFGRGPWGSQFLLDSGSASSLLIVAAVLWFAPAGRNPWSLDQLIFGQRAATPPNLPPPSTPRPDAPPAPPPGERTAKFVANREG